MLSVFRGCNNPRRSTGHGALSPCRQVAGCRSPQVQRVGDRLVTEPGQRQHSATPQYEIGHFRTSTNVGEATRVNAYAS